MYTLLALIHKEIIPAFIHDLVGNWHPMEESFKCPCLAFHWGRLCRYPFGPIPNCSVQRAWVGSELTPYLQLVWRPLHNQLLLSERILKPQSRPYNVWCCCLHQTWCVGQVSMRLALHLQVVGWHWRHGCFWVFVHGLLPLSSIRSCKHFCKGFWKIIISRLSTGTEGI